MSIFMISVVMFDLRKALPIDESNIKLIVDGEHNEIITEHEGMLWNKYFLNVESWTSDYTYFFKIEFILDYF